MKYLQLLIFISTMLIISACTAVNTRENNFVSAIDDDRMLNRVSTVVVEQFLKASGCEKRFTKQIIGPIENDSKQQEKFTSEHWIVEACGVAHSLKIDFYDSGLRVDATPYEP